MQDNQLTSVQTDNPDLTRRRAIFRMALATAGLATAVYVAPAVVRIDEAEAKGWGSKRRGGSKRWKWPSKRYRRHFPSRRRRW